MSFIAFPLLIDRNCWIRRAASPDDAASQLLEIMGRTAGDGGWQGVKEFGLRDFMMNMGSRRGLQPEAVQAANHILADLGIQWFRVDAVEKTESTDQSVAKYSVSVFFPGRGTEALKVRL